MGLASLEETSGIFVQLISPLDFGPSTVGSTKSGTIGGYILEPEGLLTADNIIGGDFDLYDASDRTSYSDYQYIPSSVVLGDVGFGEPGLTLSHWVSPGVYELAFKALLDRPYPFAEAQNLIPGSEGYGGEANVLSVENGVTISIGYGIHNVVFDALNPLDGTSVDREFSNIVNRLIGLKALAPDDASYTEFVNEVLEFVGILRRLDKNDLSLERSNAEFHLDGILAGFTFRSLTYPAELNAGLDSLREPFETYARNYIELYHTPMLAVDGQLFRSFDDLDISTGESFDIIADPGDIVADWHAFGVDYAIALDNEPGYYETRVDAWNEQYFLNNSIAGFWAVEKQDLNVEAYIQAGDYYVTIEDVIFDGAVQMSGTDDDDLLIGSDIKNLIIGGDGHDELSGLRNNDTLTGGDGNDVLRGGEGHDLLFGDAGDDTLFGGIGHDHFHGGDGFDTASYFHSEKGVNVYLQFGGRETGQGRDHFFGIEALIGSKFGDRLIGDSEFNTFWGGEGNDVIKTKGGDDVARGREGNDKLIGANSGNERLLGGYGEDIILGLDGNDYLSGNQGNDFVYGGRGNDTVLGGFDDDVLRGNLNNDTLYGGDGSDRMYGGGQNDTLYGDAERDFLLGENGNDVLDGGAGDDNLTGGEGQDVFVFTRGTEFDRIKDFEQGLDRIDLEAFGFASFASDVADCCLSLVQMYALTLAMAMWC